MRWTNAKIENEIKNVMSALNISRMPSASEIKNVTNSNGLAIKITRTGGFKFWSNKLKLENKNSETKLGNDYEILVENILNDKGYIVEKMTTKHPYNLLINNNIKVDIKVSRYYKPLNNKFKYHTFNLERKYHNCDIFICIGLNENNKIEKLLVIPSKYVMEINQLSVGVNSKYDKFKDKWGYIEKYSYFYDVTI